MNVKIYFKSGCVWCTRAKEFLKSKNIEFEEINLSDLSEDEYELEKNKLVENTGQKTFPYIFIDDKFIGGFTDLQLKLVRPEHRFETCNDFYDDF